MTTGRVIVGVDDSCVARAALRWAVDEALVRDAELDIVHSFHPSGLLMPAIAYGAEYVELQDAAKALVHRLAAEAQASAGGRLPAVREVVTEGEPGPTLVSYANETDLLVVGRRRHSRIAHAALGSCSSYCAHHAHGPVAIIGADGT